MDYLARGASLEVGVETGDPCVWWSGRVAEEEAYYGCGGARFSWTGTGVVPTLIGLGASVVADDLVS